MNSKRVLSVVLTICIMLTAASLPAMAETQVQGDVNSDSVVNNKDLGVLRRYLNDWDVELDKFASG